MTNPEVLHTITWHDGRVLEAIAGDHCGDCVLQGVPCYDESKVHGTDCASGRYVYREAAPASLHGLVNTTPSPRMPNPVEHTPHGDPMAGVVARL